MSLQQQIAEFQNELLPQIPGDVLDLILGKTKELVDSGAADRSLKVGDKIPAFSLPNAVADVISSEQLLAEGPLVISFYRGSWCPYCNLEIKALQDHAGQISDLGARLVAISPQRPDLSLTTKEKHNLEFEVLSDVGNKVIRQFGLVFALAEELRPIYREFGFDIPGGNGDDTYEIPIPATYIVDRDGRIIYAFVNADYTKRAEPSEIIAVLEKHNS